MTKDRKKEEGRGRRGIKGNKKGGKRKKGKKGEKKKKKNFFFFFISFFFLFPLTSNLPWLCCSVVCHVMYLGFVVLVFVLLLNINLSCECHP